MLPSARRRAIIRNGMAAGSVWEQRMKMDEVKGGIKVFNASGEGRIDEEGMRVYRRLRRKQSDCVGAEKRKRRSWNPPETVIAGGGGASRRSQAQLTKARSPEEGEKEILLICDGQGNDEEMEEEEDDIEIEVEERRKSFDDKEMDLPAEKEKEIEQVHEMPMAVEKKDPDFTDLKMKDSDHLPQTQDQVEEEEEEILFETQSRMQHVVDLVMWRDISKSAFVFGSGSFFLLSSSYVKDLNFSLLSAISYTGLLYIAVIFLYRSILLRGQAVELVERKEKYVVGEEEAIWVLRKVLPYLNELLFRIRALFSGDPPTTMKMAVLLFVLARCGGSITIWTLAKLAFFGIFTVPKALSSYSEQLARYGKFWLARFQDGWESCAHKKAASAAIFTVIWNLSSTIARIWAVFMLVVIMRVYQQHVTEEWQGEGVAEDEKQTQKVEVAVEEPSLGRQCWRRSGSCKGKGDVN